MKKVFKMFVNLLMVTLLILTSVFSTVTAENNQDIIITTVAPQNSVTYHGEEVFLYTVLRNTADVDITEEIKIDFFIDGQHLETVSYKDGISANGRAVINSTACRNLYFGAHTVIASINDDSETIDDRFKSRFTVIDEENPQNANIITSPSLTSITVEAEDYSASSVSPVVSGCAEGGQMIASINSDEYFDYQVDIPADGIYNIDLRVNGTGTINILSNESVIATSTFESEGWNNFITASTVASLQKGSQVLRIQSVAESPLSLNYINLSKASSVTYSNEKITYSGQWSDNGNCKFTSTPNDYAEFTVKGTRVDILSATDVGEATFSVYIDDEYRGYYSTQDVRVTERKALFTRTNLSEGTHKVKIVNLSGELKIGGVRVSDSDLFDIGNIETTKKKIAFVGDSITQGVGTSASDGSMSYPAQVGGLLGPDYMIKNFGKGGSMILKDYTLDRSLWNYAIFDEVKNYNPDYIVIMFGTNDLRHEYNSNLNQWALADNYRDAMTELVNFYSKIPSNPKIYINIIPTLAYEDESRNSTFNYGIENILAPMLQQIASDAETNGADVNIIDVYSATKDWSIDYIPDKIHPNNAGAGIIAKTVAEALVPGFVTPINIALNKPIIDKSGDYNGDWTADKINDGNTGSAWAASATNTAERNDYVVIDLGESYSIKNIILKNASTFNYRSAKDFAIYVSQTGQFSGEEKLIFNGINPSSTAGEAFSVIVDSVEARYVKLIVTSTYDTGPLEYTSIVGELEIYA